MEGGLGERGLGSELLHLREGDAILGGVVEGSILEAVDHFGAAGVVEGSEDTFSHRDGLPLDEVLRGHFEVGLCDVEDVVVADEHERLLLACVVDLLDGLPEDDGGGLLALQDGAAHGLDLLEGGPQSVAVSGPHGDGVEDQYVDASVLLAGGEAGGEVATGGGPGLPPGHDSGFQGFDDSVGDEFGDFGLVHLISPQFGRPPRPH